MKNGNFDKLLKYAQKSESKTAVSLIRLSEGYEVSYKNDLTVNVYSYLISNPSDSYFVSRLLGTSGVSSKTAGNVTTYTAGLYNHLKYPNLIVRIIITTLILITKSHQFLIQILV